MSDDYLSRVCNEISIHDELNKGQKEPLVSLVAFRDDVAEVCAELETARAEIEQITKDRDSHERLHGEVLVENGNLRTEIEQLQNALRPFADFNDAWKEWRFGPSKYLLQTKRPEDKPVMRWTEPTPPPGVPGKLKMEFRVLELWPQDFARAEELLQTKDTK